MQQREAGPQVAFPMYWDADGVMTKVHENRIFRLTRAFPRPLEGVTDSLAIFHAPPFSENIAIATSRGSKLRGRQTPRQLDSERYGRPLRFFQDGKILYAAHDWDKKIEQVLLDGVGTTLPRGQYEKNPQGLYVPNPEVQRAVLVDDDEPRIVRATLRASLKPELGLLLRHFAFVHFGGTGVENIEKIRKVVKESLGDDADIQGSIDPDSQTNTFWIPTHIEGLYIPIITMPQHGFEEGGEVKEALRDLSMAR